MKFSVFWIINSSSYSIFQSVLSSLGAPSKVFYTKADRMLIHRGEDSKKLRGPRPNYFFNYFSLGVVSY